MGGLQYAVFILPVLLLLVGLEVWVSKKKGVQAYSFADTIVNMCCGMLERLFDFFWVIMLYFVFGFLYENVAPWQVEMNMANWFETTPAWMVGLPSWVTILPVWIVGLLLGDFLAYWHHRLSHEINFLWAAHIVHHSSEELNMTTVFRVSAFAVINRSFFWIWMPILGFDPATTTSVLLFIGLFQFVTHSRLVGKLGILEFFMVTPSHHRVHHSRNEKYLDKNYGHVFIIWDRMFGTFMAEEEEPEYGITTGLDSANPYWAYLHYWSDLFRRAKQVDNWKDKVRIFVKPPSWNPEGVVATPADYKVDENGKRIKFNKNLPFRIQLYVFVNVMLVFAFFVSMFSLKRGMDSPTVLDLISNAWIMQSALVMVVSIFSLGAIMERKSWAPRYEYFRLAFVAVMLPIMLWGTSFFVLSIPIGLVILGVLAIWILRMRNYFVPQEAEKAVEPVHSL